MFDLSSISNDLIAGSILLLAAECVRKASPEKIWQLPQAFAGRYAPLLERVKPRTRYDGFLYGLGFVVAVALLTGLGLEATSGDFPVSAQVVVVLGYAYCLGVLGKRSAAWLFLRVREKWQNRR